MKCKICGADTKFIFQAKLVKRYSADYFHCDNCGFVFIGNPFWLNDSYDKSVNKVDTGVLARAYRLSPIISIITYYLLGKDAKCLDFAGGYGALTRLMRDIGFDFYWYDPYSENLLAKGFEHNDSLKYQLLTSIECFEHLPDPMEEINKMFSFSKNILFTTDLVPQPVPQPEQWWYYGLEHGLHVSFYSDKTLKYIAEQNGLNYYSLGWIHFITERKINEKVFKVIDKLKQLNLYNHAESFLFNRVKKNVFSKSVEDMNLMMNILESENIKNSSNLTY